MRCARCVQVADLRGRIDADQRLLIQFSEEKVQLAIQVRARYA